MSVYTNNHNGRPTVVMDDKHIEENVIEEEVETEMNDVHCEPDSNIDQATYHHEHAQRPREQRAVTFSNHVEEHTIKEELTPDTNDTIDQSNNHVEQVPSSNYWEHIREERAARARSLCESDPFAAKMMNMTTDILGRAESLKAKASEHEHNQDVPACTGDQHNKNCGRGIDMSLMEYWYLVSEGVIPSRPYDHWGCDSPARERCLQVGEKWQTKKKKTFRAMKWESECTRRVTRRAIERCDDISPTDEIEPSNVSPLEIQRRRQTKKVFFHLEEEGCRSRQPQVLNDEVLKAFIDILNVMIGGVCNQESVADDVRFQPKDGTEDQGDGQVVPSNKITNDDEASLSTKTITANGLSDLTERQPRSTTYMAGLERKTSQTVTLFNNKRVREETEDTTTEPSTKRLCLSPAQNVGPSGRVRDLLDGLQRLDTGWIRRERERVALAASTPTPAEYSDSDDDDDYENTKNTIVQPARTEEEPEEEGNKTKKTIVARVRRTHPPERWRAEEDGYLRLWVFQHGTRKWSNIARFLGRSRTECQSRWLQLLLEVMIAVTKLAGGDPYAGILTSAPSPTITTRSLRCRNRRTAPICQCGDIIYDTKAKILPKVAKNGDLVDKKGKLILGTPGKRTIKLTLSQPREPVRLVLSQPRKPVRLVLSQPRKPQKLRLFVRPGMEVQQDDAPTIDELRARDARFMAAEHGGMV